jgi:hypothetical protein
MPAKKATPASASKSAPAGSAPAAKATGAKAAPAKTANPAKAVEQVEEKPERAQPAAAEPEPVNADEQVDAGVPMNRAERRAKGRGKTASQTPGARGKVGGGHGPAPTHRMWANRRSG